MSTAQFPVGGPRQAVYDFLRDSGFKMSKRSDKEWTFGERTTLLLYGAGSMATIYSEAGNFKGPLAQTVGRFTASIDYAARVRACEDQGMSTSDAQAVVDAQDMKS